jgi:oxygen-independent coproporphyrinogen-3 oxidase
VTAQLGVLGETAPRAVELGLYLHVPFCAKRCFYCSFNTAPMNGAVMARYVRAVEREILLLGQAPWSRRVTLASVFLGGGTPSLLSPEDLATILATLRDSLAVAPEVEVTVECNPESVTRAKLGAYRTAGVNRISLGVQSLDESLLARLGRGHAACDARAAFAAARAAGFENISIDLMYGLPGLDLDGWSRVIATTLDWEPEHLSAYGLTLDPGSLWGAQGAPRLPPEDAVVEQYWALVRMAAVRGYEHYEISNYARPGYRSRHNQTYWRAAEYLAAGPGACGFIGDVRYGNARPVSRYCATLEEGALPIEVSERLTPRQGLAERLILGLRMADGVPIGWLQERLAGDRGLETRVAAWREAGLLEATGDRIRLTEPGFLVSDGLFVELL